MILEKKVLLLYLLIGLIFLLLVASLVYRAKKFDSVLKDGRHGLFSSYELPKK